MIRTLILVPAVHVYTTRKKLGWLSQKIKYDKYL